MKTVIIGLLMLGLSHPLHAGDKTNIILGASLDLVSTEVAISRGAIEANPMMTNRAVRVGSKTVASAAAIVFCDELRKRGHKKGAKWFSRGVLIVLGGVAAYNMTQHKVAR